MVSAPRGTFCSDPRKDKHSDIVFADTIALQRTEYLALLQVYHQQIGICSCQEKPLTAAIKGQGRSAWKLVWQALP